jgi:hypothetical protein
MVSRKPDAVCFHCGSTLDKCDVNYETFMNMAEEDRIKLKNNYKLRMMQYHNKLNECYQEQKK